MSVKIQMNVYQLKGLRRKRLEKVFRSDEIARATLRFKNHTLTRSERSQVEFVTRGESFREEHFKRVLLERALNNTFQKGEIL